MNDSALAGYTCTGGSCFTPLLFVAIHPLNHLTTFVVAQHRATNLARSCQSQRGAAFNGRTPSYVKALPVEAQHRSESASETLLVPQKAVLVFKSNNLILCSAQASFKSVPHNNQVRLAVYQAIPLFCQNGIESPHSLCF